MVNKHKKILQPIKEDLAIKKSEEVLTIDQFEKKKKSITIEIIISLKAWKVDECEEKNNEYQIEVCNILDGFFFTCVL